MKKLKKILLINWLYFSKEIIEVGDVNFLTGKNGAGKSTVIDALQIVRFLYKGIIIKHNKTEPTYTKTSLFLCEKRRFFMARTEKGVVATI